MPSPASLQVLAGPLEVKFKAGAFSTWSDSFVRLEGRWLCVYKRERDSARQGAIELGLGVSVTDISNPDASTKFPRRFDLTCNGGLLPKTEVNFRTKSRKDRDLWVQTITNNLQCLASARGQDPRFGVRELAPVTTKMRQDLMLHPIRIRSDMTVRCATGESIVTFLVEEDHVPDRVTAAAFCRQLVGMNLLHHVMWDRDFTDSPEPFVIVAIENEDTLETEDDYYVAHFLKYMDSRKFWKYIASPDAVDASALTAASNVSSGSRRAASSSTFLDRSTSSSDSGRGTGLIPGSDDDATRFSTLSISRSGPTPGDNGMEKKARKCAVCTKSFNPLLGALEVFDVQPRFECGEVQGQLQTVVRGLLNLFEEIMTAAAETQQEQEAEAPAEKLIEERAKKAEAPAVNPMEAQLLQLLSQTTTTQEQLRTQQGQMVSAISSHSKQINNLAKQLERIEATLAAKLDIEGRVA
ncbi:hypothetical protein PHMEG_00013389 [Phytophthora megakarya]|uniref:PH domain-containing protein n=1 Tax=Phytophthora megakarya TaxID=4795 RepID=A0A225W6T2_9STRA|nr:hypothetical protein PHMEG_00013389 [Phytophthora megakarya]